MKKIKLTQGKYALVDDEDYERVSQYKWFAHKDGKSNNYYAVRSQIINKKKKRIIMARFILDVWFNTKTYVDHTNHNTLDNRKINLRICSGKENSRNQKIKSSNTTGYKGVVFIKSTGKYRARIATDAKYMHIGYYVTAEEAALAYNKKAIELHGEFAFLNKV